MLLLHSQAPPSERETEKEANGDSRGPSESIARPSKCTFHSKTRLFIMRGCGSWRCEQGSRLTTQRLAGRAPVARFRSFPGGLWALHAQSEAVASGYCMPSPRRQGWAPGTAEPRPRRERSLRVHPHQGTAFLGDRFPARVARAPWPWAGCVARSGPRAGRSHPNASLSFTPQRREEHH